MASVLWPTIAIAAERGTPARSLLWVGAIAMFVLVEKLAPQGARLGRVAGVLLAAWGGWVLARGI